MKNGNFVTELAGRQTVGDINSVLISGYIIELTVYDGKDSADSSASEFLEVPKL